MLTHHAAWLLRLAHHANDPLLRDAAENAVLGRYANFPGYYFKSFETNVYQRVDYPLHPYQDLKYNAIFYNHVWPHIALIVDYLVSDAFAQVGRPRRLPVGVRARLCLSHEQGLRAPAGAHQR